MLSQLRLQTYYHSDLKPGSLFELFVSFKLVATFGLDSKFGKALIYSSNHHHQKKNKNYPLKNEIQSSAFPPKHFLPKQILLSMNNTKKKYGYVWFKIEKMDRHICYVAMVLQPITSAEISNKFNTWLTIQSNETSILVQHFFFFSFFRHAKESIATFQFFNLSLAGLIIAFKQIDLLH